MSEERKEPAKRNLGTWMALGALVVGLAYVGAGLWFISRRPKAPPAAARTGVQSSSPLPEWTATSAAARSPLDAPTREPATPIGEATLTPTLGPPSTATPVPPDPTVAPPDGSVFQLAVVHSNDTWGYTDPCG